MSWDFEKHYINGEWTPSEDDAWIEVENPATLERFARIPDGTPADADRAVAAAKAALEGWRTTPLAERIRLMKAMLANFEALHDEIIPLEVAELGAPVGFTTRTHCEYQYVRVRSYIEAAERMVLEETLPNSTVYREPVGVVACVTPWNYPLGQVVQKVVPAILMGCTVVLKPSQHTPLTACLLANAFDRAGFPKGVFNIARRALESVKHISLELGGKSPAVFLPSDDYSAAYPKILSSIFFNAGQTCTALSRLIVPRRDLARIESEFCELAAKLVVGDPTDPKTDIGPVSSKAQFEKIAEYVQAGIDEGARLVMGDVPTDMSRGYYVRPVVFSDVRNDMRIAREEIFGPVLCIIPYDTVEEAVSIANDTPYGLSGYVHAPTKAEAVAVAKRIHSGNVYINDAPRDVTAPFGGYKQSGIGREGGLAGLLEFTQQKAVFDRTTY